MLDFLRPEELNDNCKIVTHMEVSLYLNEHMIVSAALEIYDNR
jgi:hypothetical protein